MDAGELITLPPRWLSYMASDPARNMAVDEAILTLGGPPTLRFYGWSPPAISLGKFQKGRTDLSAIQETGLPIVERMTGGGAIVHWHELTYSLTLPVDHPLIAGCSARDSYAAIHAPILKALGSMGVNASGRANAQGDSLRNAPLLCFSRVTSLDLEVDGLKLVGSAQRRRLGRVLQHGSIICAPNPLQPGTAALSEILQREVLAQEVADALLPQFEALLPGLAEGQLSAQEEAFAHKALPSYRFS